MALSDEQKTDIGNRLTELRDQVLHETQQDMATRLGVGRSYYAQLESASTSVSAKRVKEIAEILAGQGVAITAEWLLNGEQDMQENAQYIGEEVDGYTVSRQYRGIDDVPPGEQEDIWAFVAHHLTVDRMKVLQEAAKTMNMNPERFVAMTLKSLYQEAKEKHNGT